MTIRIAIIGFGKIAHDEHAPTIIADPAFDLMAVAGGRAHVPAGVLRFADHHALLDAMAGDLDAVAICTPPDPRHAIARDCLSAGLDVLLEKPPTATLGELDDLVALAQARERTLFTAWHSQYAPAVTPAAAALAGRTVTGLDIVWQEDARRWHPGQDWILGAGGFGVLDAGINALSIVSRLVAQPFLVDTARLSIPADRQGPIAAELIFTMPGCAAHFDWRTTDGDRRTIRIEADELSIDIGDGGMTLAIDGVDQALIEAREYPPMYARFAALIGARASDVDSVPLRIVADAFLVGEREEVAAFAWA